MSTHILKKDGKDYKKLYKIRNPWSAEMYSGPWSDKSSLWTEDFKKQVGFVQANDGVFFMEHSDFIKGFYQFMVVQYRDDWKNQKVHLRAGKTKN